MKAETDMTTLPNTLTIEGVMYHRAPEPAPEPAPLGEPWLPKPGEWYWYLDADGDVAPSTWGAYSADRARRAFGNCFATEAEATAARDYIALTLRAWRVASDLWAERGKPGVGDPAFSPCVKSDGAIGSVSLLGYYTPYRFATRGDCDRFIAALGEDAVRRLLGGEA